MYPYFLINIIEHKKKGRTEILPLLVLFEYSTIQGNLLLSVER